MKEHFEDRSARSRRQQLSAAEARTLDAELAASAEARLWHRAGAEFDAEDAVLPGDHAASERVIARLLQGLPRRRARSRMRWVALLAAAALLVASLAGAAVLGARFLRKPAPSTPSTVNATPSAKQAAPAAFAAASAPADSAEPPASSLPALPSAAPAVSSVLPPSTAADLFSAAGQARRQGHSRQAITLLDSLQQRFPNSSEARSADLSLGMLHLKSGASALALTHFDRYLQRSPQGELAAEALWGQAQAYFAQGNQAAARRSLGTLLQRFPGAARASAARAQLGNAAP